MDLDSICTNGEGLSEIELKLLHYLVVNGVRPEREMAAALRLKQSTLNYAFKRLREKGAVTGLRYRFNLSALGFPKRVKFALRLKGMGDIESAMDALMLFPECEHCALMTGSYDLTAAFALRDLDELGSKMVEMQGKLHGVAAINPVISLKAFKVHGVRIKGGQRRGAAQADEKDLKLMAFFAANPEKNISEAAHALSIHRNTAAARWNKLQEEGAVLKRSIVVGNGFLHDAQTRFRALVFFDVPPGRMQEAVDGLCAFPEVHELDWVSSRHDLMALVRTSSVEEFQRFHYRARHDPVLSSALSDFESMVVLDARSKNTSETLAALAAGGLK